METNKKFEIADLIEDPATRLDLYLDLLREKAGNRAVLRNQIAQFSTPYIKKIYEEYCMEEECLMQKIRDLKL